MPRGSKALIFILKLNLETQGLIYIKADFWSLLHDWSIIAFLSIAFFAIYLVLAIIWNTANPDKKGGDIFGIFTSRASRIYSQF